jgi:hypothetical protein
MRLHHSFSSYARAAVLGAVVVISACQDAPPTDAPPTAKSASSKKRPAVAPPDKVDFAGAWSIHYTDGTVLVFTLSDGGAGQKVPGDIAGKWEVVGDTVQITWKDGWRDRIQKTKDGTWENLAFAPSTTFDDEPANTGTAKRTAK